MRAAVLVKPGVIELLEIALPKPSRGEVLIRIKAALTCGTDLKAFRRGHPFIPMPGPFGHEFSGIVAAVGKGVKRFREGDEIMAVHSAPCRACGYCRKKLYNLCENIMRTKILGAFAEYILLPPHIVKQNMFRKPKQLPFEKAALLEPLSCVVHGMEFLHMRKTDHALIIGSGPIGLLHLLLLKDRGVQVTVMDKHHSKLMTAKKLGADSVALSDSKYSPSPASLPSTEGDKILPSPPGGEDKGEGVPILESTLDKFDCVFECTGMPDVWENSINYVRRGGTVVLFGGCKSGTTVTYDAERLHYDEISLRGVFHYTPADVKNACGLLSKRTFNASRLISGHFSLKQIQKAFENLSKGRGIKYAVIP